MAEDVIHLLPDSVANQIAAGEVIQRPASVVKELVENSIDAGATKVQIIIKDAGRTLIQIIDNGCGMSVMDARMAFERHATSKIKQAQDLFALHTMGFRGEALPSVAAVSEIEVRTKRPDDATGTKLIISASKVESQVPDVCTSGTNIMVKRLFFNLPARRKFLKKDAVELGHIAREFERLALVNTDVELTLTNNDVVLHQLQPASLKKRICDIFGKTLDHQIIPVSTDTSIVRIDGFVSLPANARKRGALQYFFVNGRNMRHPYFHKAVLECFKDLIAPDAQPSYFINFYVDPQTIDVNIHPQKYEIKFENEQPVWQILTASIKEALGRFNASSAIDFDALDAPDIPAYNPADKAPSSYEIDLHFNPFAQTEPASIPGIAIHSKSGAITERTRDWQKLYDSFTSKANAPDEPPTAIETVPSVINSDDQPSTDATAADNRNFLQLKGRYICTPCQHGLMVIDQHRAHVRVLFDKYMALGGEGPLPSQRLIFPEAVTLDGSQHVIASSISATLANMGFDITCIGAHDWSISAVPALLAKASAADTLVNIINSVMDSEDNMQQSLWSIAANSMASSAAIKYGANLTQEEMSALIADLFRLSSPDYAPDGRPIIKIIPIEDINKLFS